MTSFPPLPRPSLPSNVQQTLDAFLRAAQEAFREKLRAMVLFGSAAEGKLRPASDVNLVLVLAAFEQAEADGLRQPLRLAHAAVQLRPMFLLESEIPAAVRSFAPKFADILRRRVILHGEDPFRSIAIPREAEIRQLKQQLLNLALRLRSVYVARGLREEQLALFVASAVGPLRSAAAGLLALEGREPLSPRKAFESLGNELPVPGWGEVLGAIETIEQGQLSEPGTIPRLFFRLLEFARLTTARIETLACQAAP